MPSTYSIMECNADRPLPEFNSVIRFSISPASTKQQHRLRSSKGYQDTQDSIVKKT